MLNHLGSPVIHTQRLVLRPYRLGDENEMFANWANDAIVTKYLTWAPHASVEVTRGIVEEWVMRYGSETVYHWGITVDGALVGDIAVVHWHERDEWAEIGYCIGRAWQGRGYMTEALRAVMRFLFFEVGFHRISLCHDTQNPASGRVMQKAGLKMEGVRRGFMRRRSGDFADIALYGVLRDEWQ